MTPWMAAPCILLCPLLLGAPALSPGDGGTSGSSVSTPWATTLGQSSLLCSTSCAWDKLLPAETAWSWTDSCSGVGIRRPRLTSGRTFKTTLRSPSCTPPCKRHCSVARRTRSPTSLMGPANHNGVSLMPPCAARPGLQVRTKAAGPPTAPCPRRAWSPTGSRQWDSSSPQRSSTGWHPAPYKASCCRMNKFGWRGWAVTHATGSKNWCDCSVGLGPKLPATASSGCFPPCIIALRLLCKLTLMSCRPVCTATWMGATSCNLHACESCYLARPWFASSWVSMWSTSCSVGSPSFGLKAWPGSWNARRSGTVEIRCQGKLGATGVAGPAATASILGADSLSPGGYLRPSAYGVQPIVGLPEISFFLGCNPTLSPRSQVPDAASPAIKAHSRPCHLVCLCHAAMTGCCSGARVGTLPTGVPGAASRAPTVAGHWTAKHRRAWTYSTGGLGPAQMKPPVAHSHAVGKRSFRRACRRVVEQGVTKYRGQILTAGQLSSAQIHRAQAMIHRQKARAVRPPQHIPAAATGRQRVLVWNSGGLAYQDFMHWLAHQSPPIDVAIILETRMAHNMEHTTGEYIVMHSAGPHAGVMIVIRKAITPVDRVTWRTVEEGRLVHVRVYGSTGPLNIIGYYQQAWQPTKVEACTKERSRLNAKLESLLAECSNNQYCCWGVTSTQT